MGRPVLLVDDHPTFRAGFAQVLASLNLPTVLDEAASVDAAFECLARRPDLSLIVYDWRLAGGGGLPGLVALFGSAPRARFMVLTASEEEAVERFCHELGVHAFLRKSAPMAVLRATLGELLGAPPLGPVDGPAVPDLGRRFVGRRREVLQCMVAGQTNKEIAAILGIAEATARDHVSTVLKILGARNRAEAVSLAFRLALLNRPQAERVQSPSVVTRLSTQAASSPGSTGLTSKGRPAS